MEPHEQKLVIILADISGYTKFMVENQLAAVHGQQVITLLIETILREIDIPLQLQEIEGDAVFLYAAHPGNDDAWQEVLAQVRTKLLRFFEVFLEAMVTAAEGTPCKCAICKNADQLKLKVIVHSGRALYAMPPAALASRARRFALWAVIEQSSALFEQMRHPVVEAGWLRRAGFALYLILGLPFEFICGPFAISRRLLSRRAVRSQAGPRDDATG